MEAPATAGEDGGATSLHRRSGIAPGAPCLVAERRTWGVERPVTHVRFTYAAEAHALVARFTPSIRTPRLARCLRSPP